MFQLKWETGRQHTGYLKALIAKGNKWDCWLIKYSPGVYIPLHTDVVSEKRHYRVNIRVKGDDAYEGQFLFKWWRVLLFRPDIMPHSVCPVVRHRLLLSIGWVRPMKVRPMKVRPMKRIES